MSWFSKSQPALKPANTSGMSCPLFREPTCNVCHRCEFWHSLEVEENGKAAVVWKCAFNWTPYLTVISHAQLNGMQRATEEMRNRFADYAQLSVRLIKALPQLLLNLPPPPPQEGGKLTEAPRATDTG